MDDSRISIRRANNGDIEELVSLLAVLFSIEEDFAINPALQRQGLAKMLDNEKGCIMVAAVDDQVIGMCSGQLTVSTAEGGPALLVEDVVVREEFRGKGIGRELMNGIARWGKIHGVSRLQLLADRDNAQALAFYRRLGWTTTKLICLRKMEK